MARMERRQKEESTMKPEQIERRLEGILELHNMIQGFTQQPLPEPLETSLCLLLDRTLRTLHVACDRLEQETEAP